MDNPNKITLPNGKTFFFRFPSLRAAKKLGEVLGVDLIREGMCKVDWAALIEDEQKSLGVLNIILTEVDKETIFNELTFGDFSALVLGFFLKAKQANVTFENGLGNLRDLLNNAAELQSPRDSPSTLLSTTSVKGIPN